MASTLENKTLNKQNVAWSSPVPLSSFAFVAALFTCQVTKINAN